MSNNRASRLIFCAALVVAALGTTAFFDGGNQMHSITAQFSNADGLVQGNEVRVHGIGVGTVTSVEMAVEQGSGNQYAVVQLDVPDSSWPLHQGTHLAIRPKGVLSNVYVDMQPGPSDTPVNASDHTYDLTETTSPVNLDALSDVFTAPVRSSIQTQLQEAVVAFGGDGPTQLNQTIANLNPLTKDAIGVTTVLTDRTPELDRLNAEFDTITTELAGEDGNLRGLIDSGNTVLSTLASHQAALAGTLDHAGNVLADLDAVLNGEQGNLQAIFTRGPRALNLLKANADALTPLIAHINPYVGDLNQLLYEFMTANGYATGTPGGIDTLRADTLLPGAGKTATGCGGDPSEQHAACPNDHPVGGSTP